MNERLTIQINRSKEMPQEVNCAGDLRIERDFAEHSGIDVPDVREN